MRSVILSGTLGVVMLLAPSCARAQEPERFSLSMFHFNVQYVPGGTRGWPDGVQETPALDLDDAGVQDQIIRETFLPVLELFEAHPAWRVTLEMQAYMVEVMLERHPDVLDLLRELVDGGQVELVSFHYSDQLFLAYPRLDLERSHELMDGVWDAAGLSPSGVVFCQEGQFGVGMAPFAAEHGRTILGLPKNLFAYQHEASYDSAPPLFELDGVDIVLIGRGVTTPEIEVQWSFFNDGELLASGGGDPYLGLNMVHDPEAVAEYEAELLAQESAGFRIATITEMVDWAHENGIEPAELPPMLDGTWQPGSTDSMRRWMGAPGALDFVLTECERDNAVLTGNVGARHRIVAAETLVAHADGAGIASAADYRDRIMGCWRDVVLAEVSDASGITPFINEVRYGLEHAAAARSCADGIIAELAAAMDAEVIEIDTESEQVTVLDEPRAAGERAAEPFFDASDGFAVEAPGRQVEVAWLDVGEAGGGLHRVEITVSPPADGERSAEVVFPLELGAFVLTPGLLEDEVVRWSFDDFDLEDGRVSIPLGTGLLGLSDGVWLVKQTDSVHVAATFHEDEPLVRFIDETVPSDEGFTWVFWVLEGDEAEALALARRLNLWPTVTLDLREPTPPDGCGCRAVGEGFSGEELFWRKVPPPNPLFQRLFTVFLEIFS
jgi:hypothetical protein